MPPTARGSSQPARTSSRETRQPERLRYAPSQPARRRRPSPAGERDEILPLPEAQAEPEPDPVMEEEVEAGNRIDLRPFTNAVIPGPLQGPIEEDAEGWRQIDAWDAFDCSVSTIVPMEEVPGPFRKSWASALATVLRRVKYRFQGTFYCPKSSKKCVCTLSTFYSQ